jgi:ankyrin repeat protein
MLRRADAPFDAADSEGNLPIHLACAENRRDLIRWLVENTGASVTDPENGDGKTPQDLLPLEW